MTRARLKRGGALLLLPLSVLPFVLIGPAMVDSHRQFERDKEAHALPTPRLAISPAERARWKPLPRFNGAVPVIAYEGVGEDGSRSVTHLQLARQLALLDALGYDAISIRQYSRWRRGEPAGMPQRPVLITFDGGRLSSFRTADRLLQRYGFRATIFVPTARISERDRALLTWKELHGMERSGRWDVQAEGTRGDERVVIGPDGAMGPAYAFRRYTESDGAETFAAWQARVTREVFDAREDLLAHGFEPLALSVPGGDYGRLASNDGHIAPQVRDLITTQFGVGFVRAPRNYPAYTKPAGDPARFDLGRTTTADDLYGWLRAKDPAR